MEKKIKDLYSEDELRDFIVNELDENRGWTYVKAQDLKRDSFENPLLEEDLIRKIVEINKKEIEEKYGGELSDEDINEVLKKLKYKTSSQEGIKDIINFFKEGVPITLEKQKVLARIKLFDFINIERNDFIVSKEVYYHAGDDTIRVDIILYVNGIPLVNIECKDPTSIIEDWTNAYYDVKYYEKKIPELYKYVQIGVAAAETAKYFPSVRWKEDPRIEEWKVEGIEDPIEAVTHMLSPKSLLDIIKNFLFYRIESGEATKVVTRYMQERAVNKIVKRVIDNLEGKSNKNKGLIWHWQGSGKTLEMIFAAYKLYYTSQLQNPSIFFIVDRKDLEEQLDQEFKELDISPKPEVIGSIEKLKEIIRHDNYKGKRGLFITLVHKFRPGELDEIDKELVKLSKIQETISNRKNIITFIDEGHRTQYGQLSSQMKRLLGEDSTFRFAFTGTPISKPEKGTDTYREFSYPEDGEKYLDKYFMTESWIDRFTVRIAYQPALEDIKGIHLRKEDLDLFLNQEFQELPEIDSENIKDKVKKRLSLIKAYLEKPERIRQVAEHVGEHFKKNIDGTFKAMLVAPSRKACTLYKKELDKILPPKYTEVVMSYDEKKDSKISEINDFREKLTKRYKDKDTKAIERKVKDNFKKTENPKILIVKDMLLTGFNAPILQTMYLDQPLKEHRLLQAIARTNRPFKDIKEAGVIIDYLGILDEFHKAFKMYAVEDIKDVLYPIKSLRKEFKEKIKKILDFFEGVPKNKIDRDVLLKTLEILSSDDVLSKDFIKEYKNLRKIFELLGSDTIKAELAFKYGWISQVYNNYVKTLGTDGEEKLLVEKYFKKTIEHIHNTTDLKKLNDILPTLKFDENYMKNLEKSVKDKKGKASSMFFETNKWILTIKQQNSAVYESVSDKAEKLLKLWKKKVKNYDAIIQAGYEILKEKISLEKRRKKLGFDKNEYKILLRLEKKLGSNENIINDAKKLYGSLDEIIFIREKKFPNWSNQVTIRKEVERIIRRFVRKYIKEYGITRNDMEELYEKILEDVIKNT